MGGSDHRKLGHASPTHSSHHSWAVLRVHLSYLLSRSFCARGGTARERHGLHSASAESSATSRKVLCAACTSDTVLVTRGMHSCLLHRIQHQQTATRSRVHISFFRCITSFGLCALVRDARALPSSDVSSPPPPSNPMVVVQLSPHMWRSSCSCPSDLLRSPAAHGRGGATGSRERTEQS